MLKLKFVHCIKNSSSYKFVRVTGYTYYELCWTENLIVANVTLQFVFCRQCLQGYHMGECMPEGDGSGNSVSMGDCHYNVDPGRAAQVQILLRFSVPFC